MSSCGDARRTDDDRRRSAVAPKGAPASGERRAIRSLGGRRVGDRRAVAVAVEGLPLPRKARAFADRLAFVELLAPSDQEAEDVDTARLVTRIQAGDGDAFASLYLRYFDRVFGSLRILLRDVDEAEDATQQVFTQVLQALPRYELRGSPFRAWLFTVMRNQAMRQLRKAGRDIPESPAEINSLLERGGQDVAPAAEVEALRWISDRELLLFIERLTLGQRQVLVLRYMLDLSVAEIAEVLDRTPNEVRLLLKRAQAVLRQRFVALGREPRCHRRVRSQVLFRQAFVLRDRRFALLR
jgi:RNA polymerase sigma-70 factor (ECF subfamily)